MPERPPAVRHTVAAGPLAGAGRHPHREAAMSLRVCAFLFGALLLANPLVGQDPKKKDDPKKDEPKKEEVKKDDAKKDEKEPGGKYRGQLPANWKKLGLDDKQTKEVYKIQAKYGEQIDKLDEQIKELKGKRDKERLDVLTPEQKKRLEELSKPKGGS